MRLQDYNTIIGSIQMRLNGCQTRSVMDRYKIGSGTLNLIMSRHTMPTGIPIEELRMMAPKKVEDLFYPAEKSTEGKMSHFQISSITMTESMHQGRGLEHVSFCWLDYKEKES